MTWVDVSGHYRATGLRGLQPVAKVPRRYSSRLDEAVFAGVWLRAALARQHHDPVRARELFGDKHPLIYRGAADA